MDDRLQTAQRVADSLFEAEHAMDFALAKLAGAVALTTAARSELGVGYKVGAAGITKLAAVSATLAAQREIVAEAHDELAVAGRFARVRPNMAGGGEKPPSPDSVTDLHAVDGGRRAA